MITKNLLKMLNDRKGPVYVEVCNFDDLFWIQAVKQDLINTIKTKFAPDVECGFELDVEGFFSKDYIIEEGLGEWKA